MSERFRFDAEDPFGTRPDEKPPTGWDEDFFDGRLSTLAVPTLVVHGDDDPRTEPDELARIRRELPEARFEIIGGGGHCPHAHPRTGERVGELISDFAKSL